MIRVRATKYDPSKRDADGNYLGSEFTSVSDVGKKYEGTTFTASNYVSIEDAYVECIIRLLVASKVDTLTIRDLEDKRKTSAVSVAVEAIRPAHVDVLYDGLVLPGHAIAHVARLNLREAIWCRLFGSRGTYVHFGYDLYMYMGSDAELESLGPPPQGMFYEQLESPYDQSKID